MLNDAKLVGFVAATNTERTKQFYQNTLGLKLVEDSPFAFVFDANGNSLRIQKLGKVSPPAYTVLGWEVADIAATAKSLIERGIVFERVPNIEQDSLGIWRTPDGRKLPGSAIPTALAFDYAAFER